MKVAFLICVAYAALGVIYAPGLNALVAFEYILVSCLPFLVASLYEPPLGKNVHTVPGPLLFWGIFALGLTNLAIIAVSVDKSPAEVLSPDGFVSIAAESTLRRYGEQGSSGSSSGNPVILALSLFLVYRLGAADMAISAWRKILGFTPLLLYALLSTEKWPMFLSGVFFFSGVFISRPFSDARRAALRYVTVVVVLGTGLAGLAQVLRGFKGDLMGLSQKLLHYILAPGPALGSWLIDEATTQHLSFGAMTFVGPLNALGFVDRAPGVHTETVIINGLETNMYTAWRFLVEDYSLFGPFLLNLVLALLFIVLRRIRWHSASVVVSGFFIFCAFLSLNVTPFVHNSISLGMFLALVYSGITVSRSKLGFRSTTHEQT